MIKAPNTINPDNIRSKQLIQYPEKLPSLFTLFELNVDVPKVFKKHVLYEYLATWDVVAGMQVPLYHVHNYKVLYVGLVAK